MIPAPSVPEGQEKPILFSGEMVRAILEGRKTQTRRVVTLRRKITKGLAIQRVEPLGESLWTIHHETDRVGVTGLVTSSPFGQPGDRLWVCETWTDDARGGFLYRADRFFDGAEIAWKWRPSIFMPRAASRLTLEVTSVRVERVQDVSEADAQAEGIPNVPFGHGSAHMGWRAMPGTNWCSTASAAYRYLWDSLNAKRGYGWDANPWVWVISFRLPENAHV